MHHGTSGLRQTLVAATAIAAGCWSLTAGDAAASDWRSCLRKSPGPAEDGIRAVAARRERACGAPLAVSGPTADRPAEAPAGDIPGDTTSRVTLPIGQTVRGVHEFDDDADWYRVSLRGGTNYAFRGHVFEDGDPDDEYAFGTVELKSGTGRTLASSFTDDYDGYVGGFDFRPQADGTFFLAIQSSAIGGHSVAFETDLPAAPPTTATIAPGQTRPEEFFSENDEDVWKIRLEKGKAYDFAVLERGSFPDAAEEGEVSVLDGRGRVLATSGYPHNGSVEDFRAPYTGTFYLRGEADFALFIGDYSIRARVDPSAGPWNPAAPPSRKNDLLLGRAAANDRIDALAGDDLVYGRGGDDDLRGGDGADAVFGGDGDDHVHGGPGDDFLYGEAGDDRIEGGFGFDHVTGGTGRDVFVLGPAYAHPPPSQYALTWIEDFARGSDKIDLAGIDANPAVAGDQAFTFIGTAASTAAGQVNYEYQVRPWGDVTHIMGHTNGDGFPEFEIYLTGRIALSRNDFRL